MRAMSEVKQDELGLIRGKLQILIIEFFNCTYDRFFLI